MIWSKPAKTEPTTRTALWQTAAVLGACAEELEWLGSKTPTIAYEQAGRDRLWWFACAVLDSQEFAKCVLMANYVLLREALLDVDNGPWVTDAFERWRLLANWFGTHTREVPEPKPQAWWTDARPLARNVEAMIEVARDITSGLATFTVWPGVPDEFFDNEALSLHEVFPLDVLEAAAERRHRELVLGEPKARAA